MEEIWPKIEERYRKDSYLRRLAILYHIRELYVKEEAALLKDSCAFREEAWLKELADLYILLQMHAKFDQKFAELVEKRKIRFVEKIFS